MKLFLAHSQPLLFQRLRWRMLRNGLRGILHGGMLRLMVIVFCSLLIWAGVFALSVSAFHRLQKDLHFLTGRIGSTLFDMLFLSLGLLLVMSSAIILYSSLFSASETSFLLSTPADDDQVFAYKYQGAVAFSSWAFILLGSPILMAYGMALEAPWYFYALVPVFILGYVLLPGSIGAMICLLLVNFFPRRRRQVLALAAIVSIGILGAWGYRATRLAWREALNRDFIQRLTDQLSFAQGPLSPNHWMTRGFLAAARRDLPATAYNLSLIWSNGLFLYVLTAATARRLFRRGFNRVSTGATHRRHYGGAWIDRWFSGCLPFLDPQTRLLIAKDFRTFRRDPAQWAQVMIFIGLIGLYFSNTRQFYQEDLGKVFQNGVSFINLAAIALLLCSYTGRFIYPMLSLEGKKFWVLGLLPLKRERLLWGKFAFSAVGSLFISEFLVIFSDVMLNMPAMVVTLHALTVGVLALGLSGLSVGLGAWMPNFRESDPSKIAVGFGGTLNLVAGLLFLIVELLLMAAPWHLRAASSMEFTPTLGDSIWFVPGAIIGCSIGMLAVAVPLRAGIRALRKMEF